MKRHAKKCLDVFQALEDKMLTRIVAGDDTDPKGNGGTGGGNNNGNPPPLT